MTSPSAHLPDLLELMTEPFEVIGDRDRRATGVRAATAARAGEITFVRGDRLGLLDDTQASIVITDQPLEVLESLARFAEATWIITKEPRLAAAQIAIAFLETPDPSIHESANVHPTAVIGERVTIGPLSSIAAGVTVGDDSIIGPGVHVYRGVTIGSGTNIGGGTVIGTDGFGYEKFGEEWLKIPHLGTVIIGDNVDVGANTCIDRGTFSDTVIEDGAKVDNLVHVAHNVRIGKNATVIALTMLGGSVAIDDGAWVAPAAAIINGKKIGSNATVGLGAVVIRDVDPDTTVAGVPAKVIPPRS